MIKTTAMYLKANYSPRQYNHFVVVQIGSAVYRLHKDCLCFKDRSIFSNTLSLFYQKFECLVNTCKVK